MALEKLREALGSRRETEPSWVLASDTVVTIDGEILGKPKETQEAEAMLSRLSGRRHQVITAWALGDGKRLRLEHSSTQVHFRPLSVEEIEQYIASGEPMDKAGAYGIQGGAGRFVEEIQGSYDAVVGLPLAQVCQALVEEGVLPQAPSKLSARLAVLQGRIQVAAQAAGRDHREINLVGVSKRQPLDRLRAALAAGLLNLGESYVQEWQEKAFQLGPGPIWHFIGRLQRNKAKLLGGRIGVVHGLDKLRTAEALGRSAQAASREIPCFVQVNLAGEVQKGGVSAKELPHFLENFKGIQGLMLSGLMIIPPLGSPAQSRRYFTQLRQLRDELATPAHPLPELSMGMSADFPQAIAEGATLIRVGSALFGPRPTRF